MGDHDTAGERILGKKKYYAVARHIARSHHENWDGTGYPDGLKGEQIPLSARIVSIGDVFDALIHKRSYKEAWTEEQAILEMKHMTGKKFEPGLMKVFLACYESRTIF